MTFPKKTIALLSFAVLMLIGTLIPLQAQSRKDKIKPEIYIMETILDQLLQASRQNLFEGKNIKGFYLDDFGLVFTVNLERNYFGVISLGDELGIEVDRSRELKDAKKDAARAYAYVTGSIDSSLINKWTEKLNKKMSTFLGTYVDINNHMAVNENVGILVSFNNFRRKQPLGQFYQVKKQDIVDYRNDRINKDRFFSKIKLQDINDDDELEEISMMGAILETSLSEKRTHSFFSHKNINGVYIDNLGVMFTVGGLSLMEDLIFEVNPPAIFSPRSKEAEELVILERKRQQDQRKKVEEKISDYKRKIIKTIGAYGPTLRFLPANQSIIVLVGTDSGFSEVGSSNILIRIKKDDVMKYSQKKLDLPGLLKLAQYEEY